MPDAPTTTANAPAPPSGQQVAPEKAAAPTTTATPATPAAEAAALKEQTRKHKIGDRELSDAEVVDELLGALGADGLRDTTSLSRQVRSKLGKLGATEKQIRDAFDDLGDPRRLLAVLTKRTGDPRRARELLEEAYAADLEERNAPKEEQEKRGLAREVADLKREKEALEKERREREVTTLAAQVERRLGKEFHTALRAAGIEKPTGRMIAEFAKHFEGEAPHIRSQEEFRLALADVARAVKRDFSEGEEERFPSLPEEKQVSIIAAKVRKMSPAAIFDLLGEEGMRALRKYDVERVKGSGKPAASQPKAEAPSNGERKRRSVDDWIAELRGGKPL